MTARYYLRATLDQLDDLEAAGWTAHSRDGLPVVKGLSGGTVQAVLVWRDEPDEKDE